MSGILQEILLEMQLTSANWYGVFQYLISQIILELERALCIPILDVVFQEFRPKFRRKCS